MEVHRHPFVQEAACRYSERMYILKMTRVRVSLIRNDKMKGKKLGTLRSSTKERGSKSLDQASLTLVERFDIEPYSDFSAKWSNFTRLVLCCIDAKFCKKIFVGKLLTRSTRLTCFCSAQTAIFQKKIVKLFRIFRQILQNLSIHFSKKFHWILLRIRWFFSEFRRYFRKCWKFEFPKILNLTN